MSDILKMYIKCAEVVLVSKLGDSGGPRSFIVSLFKSDKLFSYIYALLNIVVKMYVLCTVTQSLLINYRVRALITTKCK